MFSVRAYSGTDTEEAKEGLAKQFGILQKVGLSSTSPVVCLTCGRYRNMRMRQRSSSSS